MGITFIAAPILLVGIFGLNAIVPGLGDFVVGRAANAVASGRPQSSTTKEGKMAPAVEAKRATPAR